MSEQITVQYLLFGDRTYEVVDDSPTESGDDD